MSSTSDAQKTTLVPKSLTPNEVLEAARKGRFELLLGALETDQVDFKEQPYQLSTERQKFALLDDVTAFANHLGGILVLGCRTTRADVEGDYVDAVHPVRQDLVDFETYRSLINEHIIQFLRVWLFTSSRGTIPRILVWS